MTDYTLGFVESIAAIGAEVWRRAAGRDYPFMRYEFLHALEAATSDGENISQPDAACSRQSGWAPHHAVISDPSGVVAVMPLYMKYHSYGEYIFDWGWAEAYQRNGLDYYPKLLAAIPYSPVTGPRLAIDPHALASGRVLQSELVAWLCTALRQHCEEVGASSFHLLYPEPALSETMAEAKFTARHSFQYHWFNDAGGRKFSSFEDFCITLKARKRKAILKERREVVQQDIRIERLVGAQIDPATWQCFYQFYQLTYAKRSGHGGYLNQAFFEAIGRDMGDQIMLVVARQRGVIIAGALNLFSSNTLYGRYWGCTHEAEFLHFEACYYQGIEFCIERGLDRFDAGAQGEHKIQRGFRPVDTFSNHYIVREDFRRAIDNYIAEERAQNQRYMAQAEQMLPFRTTAATVCAESTDPESTDSK